jgi:hypothetical protein
LRSLPGTVETGVRRRRQTPGSIAGPTDAIAGLAGTDNLSVLNARFSHASSKLMAAALGSTLGIALMVTPNTTERSPAPRKNRQQTNGRDCGHLFDNHSVELRLLFHFLNAYGNGIA